MKFTKFLVISVLTLATTALAQSDDSPDDSVPTVDTPGWRRVANPFLPQLTSPQAQAQQNGAYAAMVQQNQGVPSVPVAEIITPQIQALADGLQHDPQQIFNYVHDHIKFVLYFGSKKGAALTLLEKSGNDFDQCALLVALLRAAGYADAQYKFGWQVIPYDFATAHRDLRHWWRLTLQTDWPSTASYLFNLVGVRGYPIAYQGTDGNSFKIQRVWVTVTVGSKAYQLDPSFKVSEQTAGIPLFGAMGSTSSDISNAVMTAAGGPTSNGNFAKGLSEASVRSKLTGYTTNLLNYFQNNLPNAGMQDVLGGWQITPADPLRDYATAPAFPLDNPNGYMAAVTWANEPTNLMSTLAVSFSGTNCQLFMPKLQGQRLSLTFDNNANAQLWQDDTLLAQNPLPGVIPQSLTVQVHGTYVPPSINYPPAYVSVTYIGPNDGWALTPDNNIATIGGNTYNYTRNSGMETYDGQYHWTDSVTLKSQLGNTKQGQLQAQSSISVQHTEIGHSTPTSYTLTIPAFTVPIITTNAAVPVPSIYTTLPTNGTFTIAGVAYKYTSTSWTDNGSGTVSSTVTLTPYNIVAHGAVASGTSFSANSATLSLDTAIPEVTKPASTSSTRKVVLAVTHPFGSWDIINNVFISNPTNGGNMVATNFYQFTNATYALIYAFEPDWGWLQKRQNVLDAYLIQGKTNGSREVLSETLNIMGMNWMLQTDQTERMLASQLGMLPQFAHRIGRMAQEGGKGYYIDVYMQLTGEYSDGGDDDLHVQRSNAQFDLWSFYASALEHGMIEQLQNSNIVAASTVKMLQIANTNGQAIYLASVTNWATGYNVRTNLVNYDSATLTAIGDFVNQGFYVLLPKNGSNHVSDTSAGWAGYGYEARKAIDGAACDSRMIISGGYNGGYASDGNATADTPYTDVSGDVQPGRYDNTPVLTDDPATADPIDTGDAAFLVENVDLSLGQGEPKGISVSRYYNGTRRNSNPAGMAAGWIHNYSASANSVAAPQACLGGTTPAQAAAMLASTATAIATYNGGYPDPKNWLTTSLIAKWGIDQLIRSGVSVTLGKDTLQFVKQPNGAFTPPASCSATLTQSGAAYSLQMRHGNTYKFDTSGLLVSIIDRYNQPLSLTYNESNWVSTITDSHSRKLTFNYSGTPWRLTSVTNNSTPALGVSYGYSTVYNSQGDLSKFTDAEGKSSTFVYNGSHQITATLDPQSRLVVSNIYDTQGHVTTQYTMGDTNKMWRIYWSGWRTTEFDPANGEQDFFYDDQGRLIGLTDQLGHTSTTMYDGQNHVVQKVSPLNETNQLIYDGKNNLVQQIDALGFTNQFVYDEKQNLVMTIDPLGNQSTYGYNTNFSLTGQTNGAGDWVNFTYNSDGTLHTRSDSGGINTYGYDSLGQLNAITYPGTLGNEGFVNNSLGNVTSHTDARGFTTTFQYNLRRQPTNSVAPTNVTVKIGYDSVGNQNSATDARGFSRTKRWSPTRQLLATTFPTTAQGTPVVTNIYDSRDYLVKTLDPYLQPTCYTNDIAGRVISVTDPLQRTTTYGYDFDGRKIATTNALQEAIMQTWDARGSLRQLTDGAKRTSSRGYDKAGNQLTLTNRNGKIWQFRFDGANRLTSTITPLGFSNSVTFNHQGSPSTIKDAAGQLTSLFYDAKGRLTNREDSFASTRYNYDANDNRTKAIENTLTNAWTYDAYNRASSYRDVYGNLIQYRFDANGNMTNLVYPGGKNVYYAYDSLNRLTNVTDWAQRPTTITYDLASRVKSIVRPNKTYRTMSYDAAGQVTNILEQMGNTLPIALFRFNWKASGAMDWEFAAPLPHSTTVPTRSMTYDEDNRLDTFNGKKVACDSDGNLTSGPLTNDTFFTYAYDARNRLMNAGGVTNVYDALNSRIAQFNGTNSTVYVVNPAALSQVLMRIKNGVTNYYVYGPGLLYEADDAGNTKTYHYDNRGSTVAITAGNGTVTDRIEYSAYGITTHRTGNTDTPFLFDGRYGVMTDPNSLLYMRARYYNPFICRFINPDPSGFSSGLNWYAYANGDPISLIDPFGLDAIKGTGDGAWVKNYVDPFVNDITSRYRQDLPTGLNGPYNIVATVGAGFSYVGNGIDSFEHFVGIPPGGISSLGPIAGLMSEVEQVPNILNYFFGATKTETTVIGRVKDLQNLGSGERSLLDRLPNQGSVRLNWKQNSGVLRQEMKRGLPIRDASVGDTSGQFLNAERNLLQDRDWSFNSTTSFWMPPAE